MFVLVADMTVRVFVAFTSRVTLDRQSLTILVEYLTVRSSGCRIVDLLSGQAKVCGVGFFIDYNSSHCDADGGNVRRGLPAFCCCLRAEGG